MNLHIDWFLVSIAVIIIGGVFGITWLVKQPYHEMVDYSSTRICVSTKDYGFVDSHTHCYRAEELK